MMPRTGDASSTDVVGRPGRHATPWSYPKEKVTIEEAMQAVGALRAGFVAAYEAYLAKVATFEKPSEINASAALRLISNGYRHGG
jgi:hypothetical protein